MIGLFGQFESWSLEKEEENNYMFKEESEIKCSNSQLLTRP